jgi:radical SAM family RiPP maturation amino acid epimerase
VNDQALARVERTLETAFQRHPEYLRPLLDARAAAGVPWAVGVAKTKRLLERWMVDTEFRRALAADPAAAVARWALDVDPEELRFLWDEEFHKRMLGRAEWTAPQPAQQYRAWMGEKVLFRERLRRELCVPHDPRHRAWRQRQVDRCLGHLGPSAHENIIHAPFAIELSEGCSVGCWFCGVSAERKKTDFLYTEDNRRLWREVLTVLRRTVGPAAANGFLYWATDPLDNPDYEKLALDFAHICGKFPQTTTAQPQKDPERVRALLRLSAEHGCDINRFSILSLAIFEKVMQAFTAEELLHCELVVQNREATTIQSNSGRARGAAQLARRAEAKELDPGWREAPGTIACVSGFLMNMVRKSVRLVTPCPSSDAWPNGYWVLEEGHFTDGEDLAVLLDGMMERHMRVTLRAGDRARLRPDLEVAPTADGVALRAFGSIVTLSDLPYIHPVIDALAAGDQTAGEIVVGLEDRLGWPAEEIMSFLNGLFDQGLLDEEPHPAHVADQPVTPSHPKEALT